MSFALALGLQVGAGLALLRLLDLSLGRLVPDLLLAWPLGIGWFALGSFAVCAGLGVPPGPLPSLLLLALPPVVLGARRGRPLARPYAAPRAALRPRLLPARRAWAYLPLVAVCLAFGLAVALHGWNTPTWSDDAVRLRAFAAVLVHAGDLSPPVHALVLRNGILPSFAPALSGQLGGGLDLFQPKIFAWVQLLVFAALVFAVPALRGAPERGILHAFGIFSIPLFVYHATTAYADALSASLFALGFLFALEHAGSRDPRDLARACLLFAVAGLAKAEGPLLALTGIGAAAVLAARGAPAGRLRAALRVAAFAAPLGLYGLVALAVAARLPADPGSGWLAAIGAGEGAELVPRAGRLYLESLFRSGNSGLVFPLLALGLVCLPREARGLAGPLALLALVILETALSGVLLFPQWTLDGTTVHRANLVPAVAASLWLSTLWHRAGEAERSRSG